MDGVTSVAVSYRYKQLPLQTATFSTVDLVDAEIDKANEELWQNFREWMQPFEDSLLRWQFYEKLNNHNGLLTYCVSRNHRSSRVWEMLEWIAEHGPGSYGLFYCHDDEDFKDSTFPGRKPSMDYCNVYRVHRLLNGQLTELADPFFGMIQGGIDPIDPMNRPDEASQQ